MKRSPMKRSSKPLARRTRMPRVKPERLADLKIYWKRVPVFLEEHPFCQWYMAELGLNESELLQCQGLYHYATEIGIRYDKDLGRVACFAGRFLFAYVPRSEVVHHKNKRRGARLLDEKDWQADSRFGHDAIELNLKEARAKGHSLNF
jgi:hypothetical protein